MKGTPLTTTTTYVPEADAQVSQGGGSGLPPVSGGPASALTNSAHTMSAQGRNFLSMGSDSPLIEVVTLSAGFAGRAPHDSPVDPGAHVLWRTYHTEGHLDKAVAVCMERMMLSESLKERACLTKDATLSRMAGGRHAEAFEMLRPVRQLAPEWEGPFRARVECVLARSHEHAREYDAAFDRYTTARYYAEPDPYLCAQIDTNTGRCYTAAGRPEFSYEYLGRAYEAALVSNDALLQGEILESVALALEHEGRLGEARKAAAKSLSLLAEFELAYAESRRTLDRIDGRLRGLCPA